jgi:hypothetical protein
MIDPAGPGPAAGARASDASRRSEYSSIWNCDRDAGPFSAEEGPLPGPSLGNVAAAAAAGVTVTVPGVTQARLELS